MLIPNKHSGKPETVKIGDILYACYDEAILSRGKHNRALTWSFRCQGIIVQKDQFFIMGPGDTLYQLGVDCFTSDVEARLVGYFHDGTKRKNKNLIKQYRIVLLTDEERMRI